ncbi:hypothetical protein SAMN02745146_1401 [Hymenobacter daecheongensis DSM 21074]|uniref:Uncharacterized protein n=1 Tax=Hymenobacter daecheongensis DSM 21074 TaxID=1121955 RepID=A0A1M6D812_9BACT|nr:hypothetical protein [Hymenobacter daecheongensis]SHI69128.1 hypothetical protein SAMN02745146_1401 [Hymenobacter daecheongensis DSM 21074]
MLRSVLVLLLLCPYLLVVCAGLVNRPEPPRYTAAHPYVHSKTCQQQNYLRLDCFSTCNGDQPTLTKNIKPLTPHQLLTLSKGIDLHCLTASVVLPNAVFRRARNFGPGIILRVQTGFEGKLYAPPRRG